jgi:hypothetical protein
MSELDPSELPQTSGKDTDLAFDLTASGSGSSGSKTFEVRYNGACGEEALFSALMSKGTPLIEVIDRQAGTVAACGTASLEAARGLGGAMDAVVSRVAVLIKKVVQGSHAHLKPMKAEMHSSGHAETGSDPDVAGNCGHSDPICLQSVFLHFPLAGGLEICRTVRALRAPVT